jgi:SAM-dependent methyltransferase
MRVPHVVRVALGLAVRWVLRPALPLETRKRLVIGAARRGLPGPTFLAVELLRDLARDDPAGFHHFLWANHLAYAKTYELARFEEVELEADRRLLFELLRKELCRQDLDPAADVRSVLDAGCSLGDVLRHAETSVFQSAVTLVGIDIDAHAVAAGGAHLSLIGSRIELITAGMEQLDEVLRERRFDVVMSCGALMYLDQARAARAVASMLRHAHRVVGLIDRAHPGQDNATLAHSAVRVLDETLIHDLDGMVRAAGGTVTGRLWRPPSSPDDRGVYVVVAVPSAGGGRD